MPNYRGRGKLYDSRGSYIGPVTYDIYQPDSQGRDGAAWWGEITPDSGIMPRGDYIIELADGRRGPGTASLKTYSSFGLVVDSFGLRGTGPLEHREGKRQ